jgi:acetyltransferase-like isoleucine patch superfamily enzyme
MVRELLKSIARAVALVIVCPAVVSYYVRRPLLGADRALMGSSQALSLIPGIPGQYLRTAFYRCVLEHCAPSVTIEFGTIFSQRDSHLDENVYVGPMCHLGLVHLERDVLVGAAVHIPSGPLTHGTSDLSRPIREQPGAPQLVRIGAGTWVGSAAIVMADVGERCVIAAGSVVTHTIPPLVIAGGVPARIIRSREAAPNACESFS